MDRYQKLFSLMSFSAMLLGLTIVASAQYRGRNNGYYGNQNISYAVKNLKNQARRFEKTLDRELDRGRYDGTRQEDYLNNLADRFKDAAEDLDDEYDGYRDRNKSVDEARRVMNTARQLDQALYSSRVGRDSYSVRNAWRSIENNLRTIDNYFNRGYGGWGNNGPYGRDDDRWGRDRNRRYPRTNRGYGNIRSTISNLKYKAARFEVRLDNDRYNDYRSNVEGLSDRFKNAVDDLADDYNDRDRGYDEARRVLNIAAQLDRELDRSRVSRSIRRDWNSIERDLRIVARSYNLRYRSNRSFGGLGDIFRNFPF